MYSKHWTVLLIGTIALIKGYSCQDTTQATGLPPKDGFETSLVEAMTDAGFGSKSWVTSPASIKSVLEEIYLGSAGNTRKQLGSSLYLSESSSDAENEIAKEQANLNETPGEGLIWKTANRILVKDTFPLKSSYKDQVSSIFHTEIESAPFNDSLATANSINTWVSEKTDGLITQLVSPDDVGPSSIMVLLNAVYFKGTWKYSFKEQATKKLCFYSKPGKCTEKSMMTQKRLFKYGHHEQLGAKIVSLPYNDKRYSMVILLPDKYDGLKNVVSQLRGSNLLQFIQDLDFENVRLIMPKFSTKFKANMNDVMKKMGLQSIYQQNSDFSAMTNTSGVYVSDIIHEAHISVSENGTVAAASTGAIMTRNLTPQPPEYVTYNVDHPFLYFIHFNNTEILFAGQFNE